MPCERLCEDRESLEWLHQFSGRVVSLTERNPGNESEGNVSESVSVLLSQWVSHWVSDWASDPVGERKDDFELIEMLRI